MNENRTLIGIVSADMAFTEFSYIWAFCEQLASVGSSYSQLRALGVWIIGDGPYSVQLATTNRSALCFTPIKESVHLKHEHVPSINVAISESDTKRVVDMLRKQGVTGRRDAGLAILRDGSNVTFEVRRSYGEPQASLTVPVLNDGAELSRLRNIMQEYSTITPTIPDGQIVFARSVNSALAAGLKLDPHAPFQVVPVRRNDSQSNDGQWVLFRHGDRVGMLTASVSGAQWAPWDRPPGWVPQYKWVGADRIAAS